MSPESWLHGLYWFATVFGVGVTAVDMLGILGHGGHDGGDGGHDGDHAGHADDSHHSGGEHAAPVLSILRYLRMFVYFALGFGPIGLVSEALGKEMLAGLVWAVPGGVVSYLLARAIFRFQQKDVDSSLREEDLLFEPARVIVTISGGNMGKVRIQSGPMVEERYALAADAGESFKTDEMVQIVEVTDQYVVVRRMEELPPSDAV